jgi:hypothetical protein
MGTAIKWILAGIGSVLAGIVLVEAILLKASRYRLTHGDGRERSFRRKG